MKPNERVRAVYHRRKPDQVPLILDLSHWYKHNRHVPFNLAGFSGVEEGLVALHRKVGAVAYCEMGPCYALESADPEVRIETSTKDGVFTTRVVTPLGTLEDERVFNAESYSYGISRYLLQSPDDFPIIEHLMERLRCRPMWERYLAWEKALGDLAFPYVQLPYSGSGFLVARYMGPENTIYAVQDEPEKVARLVAAVNACNLRILDFLLESPFETIFLSDNYDSNVQPKVFFDTYVRDYYSEVARRAHARGKFLAVHVDGESRGILGWLAECGVDCADAVTPSPMFSQTPAEMRRAAGPDLILSGGIPANIFDPSASDAAFVDCVRRWLDTRLASYRLFMAAGDQVPPHTPWSRVEMLPELVARYGRY